MIGQVLFLKVLKETCTRTQMALAVFLIISQLPFQFVTAVTEMT